MAKAPEFIKTKLALGVAAIAIGVPALAFALFWWSQPPHMFFGGYAQYMCIFGGLGATISGSLMVHESLTLKKPSARPVKEPALEFLVMTKHEEEQTIPT